MAGSLMLLPEADLVAWIRSPRAEATSLTELINITYKFKTIIAIINISQLVYGKG